MADKKVLIGVQTASGGMAPQPWSPGDQVVDPDGNPIANEPTIPLGQEYPVLASQYAGSGSVVSNPSLTNNLYAAMNIKKIGTGSFLFSLPNLARSSNVSTAWPSPTVTVSGVDYFTWLIGGTGASAYACAAIFVDHVVIQYTGSAWEMRLFGEISWLSMETWNPGHYVTLQSNSGINQTRYYSAPPQATIIRGHICTIPESGSEVSLILAGSSHGGTSTVYGRLYIAGSLLQAGLRFEAAATVTGYAGTGFQMNTRVMAEA